MRFLTAVLTLGFLPGVARGDQIKSLVRGDQSLSAYYLAIQGAQQTIDIATYVIEPCQSAPKLLLGELIKKAKAGVKVRFVIEAWAFKDPNKTALPAWLVSQTDKNLEVRIYGSANMLQGDRPRTHEKVFIVDGKAQIVGGRNWTDEYFGLSSGVNYLDQDLFINGDSAANAVKFFDELWKSSAPQPGFTRTQAGQQPDPSIARWAQRCLAPNGRDTSVAQYIRGHAKSILQSRPTRSCETYYVADEPDFMSHGSNGGAGGEILGDGRLKHKHSTGLWLEFIEGTKTKLELENQYYMPWARVAAALKTLRTNHKSVEIWANMTGDIDDHPAQNQSFTCWIQSLAHQTNEGSQHVSLISSRGTLRDSWAMSQGGYWRIHTKTGVRDGTDVIVGSWNMDPRSYATNLEDAVVVTGCPALASDIHQQYDQLKATVRADVFCSACSADAVPGAESPTAPFCGGIPSLY